MLVITHYQRLLNYIVPDFVHVMSEGRIVRSGGKELALELEEKGYAELRRRGGVRRPMTADARSIRTKAEEALPRITRGARRACPAATACARARATPLSPVRARSACRIAASRTGNTPTSAR